MNELSRLALSPAEMKKLSSMGITSIKQLSMSSSSMTGLSEAKAETVIKAARQYIANEAVISIEVLKGKPEVVVTLNYLDQSVRQAILSVLEVSARHTDVQTIENRIIISQKYGFQAQFRRVRELAAQWKDLVTSQQSARDIREGMTIDKNALMKLARSSGFEGFADAVFKGIIGNDVMKRSMALSLFSTYDEPVHTLVIGDPGSAKTLARDIIVGNFGGVTTVGANTTKSGLVCNLATGEPGALAAADQKVVLIDEFDKISGPDVQACYELLSNGRCSVHSGRIHTDIVSKFILIAFANPATATFTGNPVYDIGMESTLLSRFSFIVKTDMLGESERRKLFTDIFTGKMKLQSLPPEFDQWVKLARRHEPKLKVKETSLEKFTHSVLQIVDELSSTPLRRDLRMANHARRIALSLARAEFADVNDKTLERAQKLVESNVRQWDE